MVLNINKFKQLFPSLAMQRLIHDKNLFTVTESFETDIAK